MNNPRTWAVLVLLVKDCHQSGFQCSDHFRGTIVVTSADVHDMTTMIDVRAVSNKLILKFQEIHEKENALTSDHLSPVPMRICVGVMQVYSIVA